MIRVRFSFNERQTVNDKYNTNKGKSATKGQTNLLPWVLFSYTESAKIPGKGNVTW